MTGYTVHTGASKKFVSGWDHIFGDNGSAKQSKTTKKKAGSITRAAAKSKAKRKAKKK